MVRGKFNFKKKRFIYFKVGGRETAHMSGRKQRERERITSRIHAEHKARPGARSHNPEITT